MVFVPAMVLVVALSGVRPAGITPTPSAGHAAATQTGPVVYSAPAPLRVVRAFEPPPGPYGPGHRGVDLAAAPGAAVVAAADGTVTFAGSVAGRGVVVVSHADGIRTEYEPLRVAVHRGDEVRRAERLGTVLGRHTGCAPASCLHWGARRGEVYLDPLSLLRPLGPVRLLPWDSAG